MKRIAVILIFLLFVAACTQTGPLNSEQNPGNESTTVQANELDESWVVTEQDESVPKKDVNEDKISPEQEQIRELKDDLAHKVDDLRDWDTEITRLDFDDFAEYRSAYHSDRSRFEDWSAEVQTLPPDEDLLQLVDEGEELIHSIDNQIQKIEECGGLKQRFPDRCEITQINSPDYKPTEQVDYKYEEYHLYADEGNEQLEELLDIQDLEIRGLYARQNNSVFYAARWTDSWEEEFRIWAVEVNAETGELIRYKEITNEDRTHSVDRRKIWWKPN